MNLPHSKPTFSTPSKVYCAVPIQIVGGSPGSGLGGGSGSLVGGGRKTVYWLPLSRPFPFSFSARVIQTNLVFLAITLLLDANLRLAAQLAADHDLPSSVFSDSAAAKFGY
jgi:hypothetical protein